MSFFNIEKGKRVLWKNNDGNKQDINQKERNKEQKKASNKSHATKVSFGAVHVSEPRPIKETLNELNAMAKKEQYLLFSEKELLVELLLEVQKRRVCETDGDTTGTHRELLENVKNCRYYLSTIENRLSKIEKNQMNMESKVDEIYNQLIMMA